MYWKIILKFYLLYMVQSPTLAQFWNPQFDLVTDYSKSSNPSSERCTFELNLIKQALDAKEPWATRLIDTWAKVGSGYLKANIFFIGDFDSCIHFQHRYDSERVIQGQHCLIGLSSTINSTLDDERSDLSLKHFANFLRNNRVTPRNGFCMPVSCTSNEVVAFLNKNFLSQNDLVALGGSCRDVHAFEFGALQYFAISLFSIFAIILIASTIYDIVIHKTDNPKPNKLLASFSVYTNGYKLFDMTKIKSQNSINCLHGLRGMSILWIIFGHRFHNQNPYGNPIDVRDLYDENVVIGSMLKAYPSAVDTFFVMGGVLMATATLRDCEKKQLNIFRNIWKRYIRYTPVFAALILFAVSLAEYFFKGPFYTAGIKRPCVESWWYALLHIQNYLPFPQICLNHAWYLSVDFQLFLISPLIIWLIFKYGKALLLVPIGLCIGTIIYIISIAIIRELEVPSMNIMDMLDLNYLEYIYFVTHSRAGPWFIGMILGYVLHTIRGRQLKIGKILNGFLWIVAFSILLTIILLQYAISIAEDPLARAYHVSYMALHRNLWAVGICWIIFACQHLKTGGIVRWFLSLPQWLPLSRMGLSVYLVGLVYQLTMMLNQRVPLYMNFWSAFPIFISDTVIIGMLGSILYLTFEAPPLIIEDYFYRKFKGKEA